MSERELAVTEAFVSIANSLVEGYDLLDLYLGLTGDCVRLLDIEEAGLLLADSQGILHVMAASSERALALELFQLQRDQGPCLECFREGAAVLVPDLAVEEKRWPQFVDNARSAGFASVHALPMRLRDKVLGALGLFGSSPGRLDERDLALGQALAHVASVALVAERATADSRALTGQLQAALTSRVTLEQAKGILAQSGELEMDRAFAVLRRYARDHNLRLAELAAGLVGRDLRPELLLTYATDKGVLP
jgi:transcriptional regulator with GAF, ATPase, and Fis domain